ncbi:4'-phosphopantetheinyl transferase family protein [Tepidibacter hydrothermalis]|uniref:4'-phosphopantetheinyl transferase superfamily protein n=1 Tax=Tepidibacter hydrothermalis TaxID=3036126 RepID=A0ABY8EFW8_9FIRM|nr:4'-phosphopantetheinyl transferase superfamily protein [Tepidibacter hydrothermalis]WFD11843.1 4'-phosphopantetheinyl transferase superfamily protein [Tepidibacter hydrothermalis]
MSTCLQEEWVIKNGRKVLCVYISQIEELNPHKWFEYIKNRDVLIVIVNSSSFKDLDNINDYLTDNEQLKRDGFRQTKDKNCFAVSHGIVNYLYSHWIGCKVAKLPFRKGIFLKPYIDNDYRIQYNITHSMNRVGLVFSTLPVGIDIECVVPTIDYKSIIKECFHKEEQFLMEEDVIDFYKVWVAKEAYLKLKGYGLNRVLNSFYMSKLIENKMTLIDDYNNREEDAYIFEICSEYIGALCIE